ncbi:hypothetical protein Patl1_12684 [Pistacia atlantica]|uniref:Uncharacterized protein n=1 Tax=Pistacia atlantica TaxID=434234 RepID=A0ACC1AVE6_9ROSI|nr:hypothetical protein Patl1_12684 [Pistacia atlantica]
MARNQNWSLLRRRFKTAVKKLSFLLNLLNASKRRLASIMCGTGTGGGCFNRRSRSFDYGRCLGLRCIDDEEEDEESDERSSVRVLRRTRSYAYSSDDDINRRADIFISNFRRRLFYERQVSLELRYRRGTNFD